MNEEMQDYYVTQSTMGDEWYIWNFGKIMVVCRRQCDAEHLLDGIKRIAELEAENARLKARVEEVEGYWFTLTQSFKDATIEIEALREAQRWIPVEERLPVRDGQYLVALEGATTDIDILFYSYSEGYSWDLWGKGRVTHWREIDAPSVVELPEEGKK